MSWISSHYLVLLGILCLSLLVSCQRHTYRDYSVIQKRHHSDAFLILLVDAPHLDYSHTKALLRTLVKHPNGSKNGDVGHAWVYLEGKINGERVYVEGGHSGELGILQAKYLDGIMNYIDYGAANPTKEQMLCPSFEPNPVKYLWETQYDGFFEEGSGGHLPTLAVKVDLTEEQFLHILFFIENYPYREYSLTWNQCSTFVAQVAALAGLWMDVEIDVPIDQEIIFGGRCLRLWDDEQYSSLTLATPDSIECSLMDAVAEGRAQYALNWYLRHRKQNKSIKKQFYEWLHIPCRAYRWLEFKYLECSDKSHAR